MTEVDLWKHVEHGQIAIPIVRSNKEFELIRNKLLNERKGIYAYKFEDGLDVYKWISDFSNRIPHYYLNKLRREGWQVYI